LIPLGRWITGAPGNVCVITGRGGPFGPSAALVVITVGRPKTFASFTSAVTLVMYSGTLVLDTVRQASLVILQQ
jgi:hypothetical protein